jgi:hypothetical protein
MPIMLTTTTKSTGTHCQRWYHLREGLHQQPVELGVGRRFAGQRMYWWGWQASVQAPDGAICLAHCDDLVWSDVGIGELLVTPFSASAADG